MKIVIGTQEEPFYLPLFFERFLTLTEVTVVGAVIAEPFNGTKDWLGVLKSHWQWYGAPTFLAQGARFAMRKALDRLPGERTQPYSVRSVMARSGVPVWPYGTVNEPGFVERATAEGVDAFVSVAYPRKARMSTLDAFPHGGINLHLGPLPRYQGLNPLFWCLLHKEPQSAVTIHRMSNALDGGVILAQAFFPLNDVTSLDVAYRRAIDIGPSVLDCVLKEVAAGTVEERPNPAHEATYYGFPSAADGKAFRQAGKRFW